jgi:hypothetical protein
MKSAVHCPPSNSLRNLSILLLVLELLRIIGFRYSLTYWFITPWSNISILAALLGWSAAQDTRKFGSGFGSLVLVISTGQELLICWSRLMWGTMHTSVLWAVGPSALFSVLHIIEFVLLIRRYRVQRQFSAGTTSALESVLMMVLTLVPLLEFFGNLGIVAVLGLAIAWHSRATGSGVLSSLVGSSLLILELWRTHGYLLFLVDPLHYKYSGAVLIQIACYFVITLLLLKQAVTSLMKHKTL